MALDEVVHHKKCACCGRQRQTEAHQNWIRQRRDFAAVLASVLDSHYRVFFEKIVRDVEANVAAPQHGQRNQDRRDRLNGEAASTKTLRHFLTSPIDPCLSFATGIFR